VVGRHHDLLGRTPGDRILVRFKCEPEGTWIKK
jgi:hypothetical protein